MLISRNHDDGVKPQALHLRIPHTIEDTFYTQLKAPLGAHKPTMMRIPRGVETMRDEPQRMQGAQHQTTHQKEGAA